MVPIDVRFSKKRFSDGVLELILEKQSPGGPIPQINNPVLRSSWFIVSKFVSKTEF